MRPFGLSACRFAIVLETSVSCSTITRIEPAKRMEALESSASPADKSVCAHRGVAIAELVEFPRLVLPLYRRLRPFHQGQPTITDTPRPRSNVVAKGHPGRQQVGQFHLCNNWQSINTYATMGLTVLCVPRNDRPMQTTVFYMTLCSGWDKIIIPCECIQMHNCALVFVIIKWVHMHGCWGC